MYLYLKFGNVVKIVSNVTIDDDCGPVVDGKLILDSPRHEDSAVSSKSTIDAISWFKSLPMEAVYIDCGARDARWCPKSATIPHSEAGTASPPPSPVRLRRPRLQPVLQAHEEEKPFMPESARPLYSEHPGVLDFNPIIDEMFERAEELFCNWDSLEEKGELNKEIAKILHCYVFPAVMFRKEDIPILKECMRIVIHKQEQIEKYIVDKEKHIAITETYLNKQKEMLLATEELTTQSYLQACSKEFVEMFYIHVTRDIQSKNMKLDIVQLKINDLKKSKQDPEKLERLKKDRDRMHEVVQRLLDVREAIRNHLYRPFIPQRRKRRLKQIKLDTKSAMLQSGFQKVHQQLMQDKDELKQLCYRKLHTASMREALESSIQMLKCESPTDLGDFSEFSVYCGSREENRKQWKSMQARVDGWMSTESELHRQHMEGCQLIKDLADGMLSDLKIACIGVDATDVEMKEMCETLGSNQAELSSSSSASGGGAPNDTGEDGFSKRAPMVQVLKDQVVVHTWEMAERVVNRMNFDTSPGSRHINRAWVCYCPHFWKEAGAAVESIYSHYHALQARKIHRLASSAALADIMDSSFFREFFLRKSSEMGSFEDLGQDVTVAGGTNHLPPMDAVSAASLDLQRCSVTDLYALANRDGARLMGQMIDLESIKCSVSSIGSSDSNEDGKKDSSKDSSSVGVSVNMEESTAHFQHTRPCSSGSDSGASVHSDDLFDEEDHVSEKLNSSTAETVRSSQTVTSVLGLFDSIVEPYHEKVKDVLKAQGVMEKMRAVWQSVDFLSKKTGEVCKARGMDTLLPISIFATASFSEDLFVKYYVQLLILTDLKPSFAMHSMYDFSLTNALATYMYLFEAKFSSMDHSQSDA